MLFSAESKENDGVVPDPDDPEELLGGVPDDPEDEFGIVNVVKSVQHTNVSSKRSVQHVTVTPTTVPADQPSTGNGGSYVAVQLGVPMAHPGGSNTSPLSNVGRPPPFGAASSVMLQVHGSPDELLDGGISDELDKLLELGVSGGASDELDDGTADELTKLLELEGSGGASDELDEHDAGTSSPR